MGSSRLGSNLGLTSNDVSVGQCFRRASVPISGKARSILTGLRV